MYLHVGMQLIIVVMSFLLILRPIQCMSVQIRGHNSMASSLSTYPWEEGGAEPLRHYYMWRDYLPDVQWPGWA